MFQIPLFEVTRLFLLMLSLVQLVLQDSVRRLKAKLFSRYFFRFWGPSAVIVRRILTVSKLESTLLKLSSGSCASGFI